MEDVINALNHHFGKLIFLLFAAVIVAIIVFFVSKDVFQVKKKTAGLLANISLAATIALFVVTGILFK